jgi:hypothetical protein
MDFLNQNKLSKSEWETLEVPVPESEHKILMLIRNGYADTSVVTNYTKNMMYFSKLQCTIEMHYYIYTKYFQSSIDGLISKHSVISPNFKVSSVPVKKLKSADAIRIQNINQSIEQNQDSIFEFSCLNMCKEILKKMEKYKDYSLELYTLIQWKSATIQHTNPFVLEFVDCIISLGKNKISVKTVIANSSTIIEKNGDLHKYQDLSLFAHQKEIYTLCRIGRHMPKLLLYTAPTGTGKTLTPLGLSEGYKIVFVCVARHIGLALAKSAISIGKKIAFAFGCETASDIRLHYFSAVDYEKNKRSGGIGKVDNSNGNAVEIMICDVQSYLIAMYYMQSFNDPQNLLLYWDEPTMTLDHETHPLHTTIHELWEKNTIPNVVLSCATLPNEIDIQDCIQDFRQQFMGAVILTITSYDCKKSIPMINTDGYCFMPHIHCESIDQLHEYASFCEQNKTLLRYFDLQEIVDFIDAVHLTLEPSNNYHMDVYFETITDITMNSLKLYYLRLISMIDESQWLHIKRTTQQKPKFNKIVESSSSSATLSGVLLTTKDSYTLTDGPTIYLADNLLNLAKFYIKTSEIPEIMLKQLWENIHSNEKLFESLQILEDKLAEKLKVKDNAALTEAATSTGKSQTHKKTTNEKDGKDEATIILKENMEQLKKQIVHLSLNPEYIPNRPEHQYKWTRSTETRKNAFTQSVGESTVKEIMELEIPTHYKLLVLMGIGVLIKQDNKKYEEIVKRLAQEQKLFLILASSDFIYGTNYQFCHGFIGKDLADMTSHKILQAMGRIGRNSSHQDYSVRFRNDDMIHRLFQTPVINREAINMNNLLTHA